MDRTPQWRLWLALSASTAALTVGEPALAQAAGGAAGDQSTSIAEIVVTAQRRSEILQSVPIAVSAFSQDALKVQRLDGGNNLVLSIPNVNYTRSNFGGYNFQIRGIGQKVITGGAESGVSINENNLPIWANNLSDTDFYDVERVEVLRGPQGTLYGRNATGGAVNVITAKPTDSFSTSLTGEFGNYDSKKVNGYINIPIGDDFALRVAGFWLNRDGFGTNIYNGDKIDGRDLGSSRVTLSFKPNDRFRAYLMYEHFQEDDTRNRVGKQLCIKDPGLSSIGGVPTSAFLQGATSQGCLPGSLYSDAAYGTINTTGTLAGIYEQETGLLNPGQDAFGDHGLQNRNSHDIQSVVDPRYQVEGNLFNLNMAWDVSDHLTLESITGYNHSVDFETEDYNRLVPGNSGVHNVLPSGCAFCTAIDQVAGPGTWAFIYSQVTPNGFIADPQVGTSNKLRVFDQEDDRYKEFTEEVRLSSSFTGPFNFTAGGIYVDDTHTSDYYVFFNPLTAVAEYTDALGLGPIYIDPSNPPSVGGHNYYNAHQYNKLQSWAVFGEANYKFADDLKLTLGLRETADKKTADAYPIELAVVGPGGFPQGFVLQNKTFHATTGRINLEWTPHLSFTDQTTIYAQYARGYKSGGFNTPCQNNNLQSTAGGCGFSATYQPEFIDSFEIGTKNTTLGGSLMLNLTGFYYDYSGYQISTIVAKSSVNSNIDAKIYGLEFESIWRATHELTFNANIGYMHTEITDGAVIDQLNPTQGDPSLTLVKSATGANCLVNTAALAAVTPFIDGSPTGVQELDVYGAPATTAANGICGNGVLITGPGTAIPYGAFGLYNYGNAKVTTEAAAGAFGANGVVQVADGVPVSLKGKQLPNSPDWTVSVGAQYVWRMGDWKTTLRGDYFWQDASYARIFNTVADQLRAWDNINATLTLSRADWGLDVQLFVKNLLDNQPLTDAYLTDASSGLFTNTFSLDPRTFGISITKRIG